MREPLEGIVASRKKDGTAIGVDVSNKVGSRHDVSCALVFVLACQRWESGESTFQ